LTCPVPPFRTTGSCPKGLSTASCPKGILGVTSEALPVSNAVRNGRERMAGKRLKARVVGRVQGVFFRASTEDQAQALGLTGWVRNTSDGAVEVLAEGEEQSLQRLVAWLQRGPSGARVDGVEQS